jgi:GTP-binding protein Era
VSGAAGGAPARCGFAAVLGAPNAGKSTLINTLVGEKVTIVSPTAQTTRSVVRGIAIHENSQIVFIDTPGLFAPRRRLERAMVSAAWESRMEADIVLLVCDAASGKALRDTRDIVARLKDEGCDAPCLLVLNKIDRLRPQDLLPLAQELNALYGFAATYMISAEKNRGVDKLLRDVARLMPEGPFHYPEDEASDMPMRLLAAEITREKLFHKLYQELPHDIAVITEQWEQRDDGSAMVNQVVLVARESQKGIILGKGGSMLKEIGEASRKELEEITGARLHLKIFVKVHENWAEDAETLRIWGLDD